MNYPQQQLSIQNQFFPDYSKSFINRHRKNLASTHKEITKDITLCLVTSKDVEHIAKVSYKLSKSQRSNSAVNEKSYQMNDERFKLLINNLMTLRQAFIPAEVKQESNQLKRLSQTMAKDITFNPNQFLIQKQNQQSCKQVSSDLQELKVFHQAENDKQLKQRSVYNNHNFINQLQVTEDDLNIQLGEEIYTQLPQGSTVRKNCCGTVKFLKLQGKEPKRQGSLNKKVENLLNKIPDLNLQNSIQKMPRVSIAMQEKVVRDLKIRKRFKSTFDSQIDQ